MSRHAKYLMTACCALALAILALWLCPAMADELHPSTPDEVLEAGRATWTAFAAGKWALGIGALVTFVGLCLRAPWLPLVERIPARWRTAVPLALSGLASALLVLTGEAAPELAALLWPATAGAAIGFHEAGETITGRRYKTTSAPRHRRPIRASIIGLCAGVCLLLSGCALHSPPTRPLLGGIVATDGGGRLQLELASVEDGTALAQWCRVRQTHRWWSSALAQAASVLAGGLAAAALARDDDGIDLGLQVGGLVSAGLAAGAETYSSAQAGAYERHCAGVALDPI